YLSYQIPLWWKLWGPGQPDAGFLRASRRSTARTIASGEGCTYFCDTVTLLWPMSFIIVKASAPDSPSGVPNVWRKECGTKSAGSTNHPPVSMLGCYLRFHHSLRFRRQLLIQSRFHEPARGLAPGLEAASKPEVIQSF